jgi:hypothetical protein
MSRERTNHLSTMNNDNNNNNNNNNNNKNRHPSSASSHGEMGGRKNPRAHTCTLSSVDRLTDWPTDGRTHAMVLTLLKSGTLMIAATITMFISPQR